MKSIKILLIGIFSLLLIPSVCLAQNSELARKYWKQAQNLKALSKCSEAADLYVKAAETELQNSKYRGNDVAVYLTSAGNCYRTVGNYDKALSYFTLALQLSQKMDNWDLIVKQLNNIGSVYNLQGQYDEALEYHNFALDISKKAGNKPGMASQYNNIGTIQYSKGEYQKARSSFLQSLEISTELDKKTKIASVLNNIAMIDAGLGEYVSAIKNYTKALKIYTSLEMEADISLVNSNIGGVYYSLGEYDKAMAYYRQTLETDKKLGLEGQAGKNYINIGSVYDIWGEYDKAIENYNHALLICKKLGQKETMATAYNNIGQIYSAWGKYDKSIDNHKQALEIAEKSGLKGAMAIYINNIGEIYRLLNQHNKAINNYKQALEIAKKSGLAKLSFICLNNIGLSYQSLGQFDKAFGCYEQCVEIASKTGLEEQKAMALNRLGELLFYKKEFKEGIELIKQALDIYHKLKLNPVIADTLSNIGMFYYYLEQYEKAIESFQAAIEIKEQLRKTAIGDIRRDYLASQIHTYQHLASAYLKINSPEDILQSIELSRAKLLTEKIAGIDSKLSVPTLDEIQQGLGRDEAVLIFSNIDLDNFIVMAITDSDISIKEINKDSYLTQTNSLYQKPILLMLDKQRGISIKSQKKKSGPLSSNTETKSEFEKSINYYRMTLIQSLKDDQTNSNNFSRTLYNLLIKPSESTLANKKHLIIVPDGILGFLPFETLVNEKNQYLAEIYDIRYTHSMTISALLNKRKYKKSRNSMLAFGGAVYDQINYDTEMLRNEAQLDNLEKKMFTSFQENSSLRNSYEMLNRAGWNNLPGTLSEVKNISTIVNGSEVLTGDNVTEDSVKALSKDGKLATYKVLHFATHGLVVPSLPELSAIVLSQFKEEKGEEDGYLRMGEIADLDINADFVNLSACETGLGKIYGGEGVVGLTQSFLIAGANGLSVSLWQVADESTAKFMTEVYTMVQNDNIGYDAAIAKVKRGFINGDYGNKWKSPFYWAPFVYYGK